MLTNDVIERENWYLEHYKAKKKAMIFYINNLEGIVHEKQVHRKYINQYHNNYPQNKVGKKKRLQKIWCSKNENKWKSYNTAFYNTINSESFLIESKNILAWKSSDHESLHYWGKQITLFRS